MPVRPRRRKRVKSLEQAHAEVRDGVLGGPQHEVAGPEGEPRAAQAERRQDAPEPQELARPVLGDRVVEDVLHEQADGDDQTGLDQGQQRAQGDEAAGAAQKPEECDDALHDRVARRRSRTALRTCA